MSLQDIEIDKDIENPSMDNLGANTYRLNSGLYEMVIDLAYTHKSAGGAGGITFHFKHADPAVKQTLRQTWWLTTKAGLPYFLGGKNKDKKIYLPDMQRMIQLAKITVDKQPNQLVEEPKMIKLWNNKVKAEVPTEVQVVSELIGKTILLGVRNCRKNKEVMNDNTKKYEPVAEELLFNDIHRVFYPDGFSVEEKKAGAETPEFVKIWKKKHTEDYVEDTYKDVGARPGSPAAASATAALDDDLFDD